MEECSEASLFSNEDDVQCPGPLFRVKLFLLGEQGCGKTSLVQSLLGPSPRQSERPTEGVNVELWYPFKTSKHNESLVGRKLTGEEHHLIVEIWDLTGRQICQAAHQTYLTKQSLFLLLYNRDDPISCDSVPFLYNTIQHAVPGSKVLLVSTKCDRSPLDGNKGYAPTTQQVVDSIVRQGDTRTYYIKRDIEDLKVLSRETQTKQSESANKSNKNENKSGSGGSSPVLQGEMARCERFLKEAPNVPSKALNVSCVTGQGLDDLKTSIFKAVLDPAIFPHLDRTIKPSTIALYDEILKLRERDFTVLSWYQYKDIARHLSPSDGDDTLEEETAFLQTVGGLLDFRIQPPITSSSSEKRVSCVERYICIYPAVLANGLCSCLVDDDKRAFKFESCRFWPKDSGFKHPDPHLLSKVLEAIPKDGFIRESLIPLLWQENNLFEDQVLNLINILSYRGLLVHYCHVKTNCEGLALPYYPQLSVHKCLYAALLDKLPNNRPQLNWTPKPFKGDLQITMCYVFPTGLPVGVAKQLLAHCHYMGQDSTSYRHMWKFGVLLRHGEVTVCAEHDDTQLNLSCRVNADEPGQEDSAVQVLWMSLAPFMITINNFLQQWPGIFYKLVVQPLGNSFYNDEKVENEPMIPFLKCLVYWLTDKKYTFKDGEVEREINLQLLFPFRGCPILYSLDDWLKFVLVKQYQIKPEEQNSEADVVLKKNTLKFNPLLFLTKGSLKLKAKKKKSVEVKWKLEPLEDKSPSVTEPKQCQPTSPPEPTKEKSEENGETSPKFVKKESTTPDRDVDTSKSEDVSVSSGDKPADGGTVKVRSEEEEIREATRIASGFVAAIMATAVADFISSECESNHTYREVVSAAQVAAAKVTAEAARAAQTGDIDGAAKAVLQAVRAVESAVAKTSGNIGQGQIKSRLCAIV